MIQARIDMIQPRPTSSNLEKQLQIQGEPAQYARKNRPIDENFQSSALRIHKAFPNRGYNKRLHTEQNIHGIGTSFGGPLSQGYVSYRSVVRQGSQSMWGELTVVDSKGFDSHFLETIVDSRVSAKNRSMYSYCQLLQAQKR